MLKKTAVEFFVKPGIVAQRLGITRQAFWSWGRVLPYWAAEELEEITNGAIKLDPKLYVMDQGTMVPK